MTQREIIMQQHYGIAPDSEVCGNCKHFVQHYISNPLTLLPRFSPLGFGHCTFPRVKNRTVHDTCDKFEPAFNTPDEGGAGELSPDEREFIEGYRKLPEGAQRAVTRALEASIKTGETRKCRVIPLPVKAPESGAEQK